MIISKHSMDCLRFRLTHALVHSHTVFIIVSEVGLILFPCGVKNRGAIQPAEIGKMKINKTSLI